MLRRIILHVGADKTGSTTIQKTFDRNRALLSRHGFCYAPDVHHAYFAAYFSKDPMTLDYFSARKTVLDRTEVKARAKGYVNNLVNILNEGDVHTLVLSYEGFLDLDTSELLELKSFIESFTNSVQVVYYLRPHLSYAVSAMSQRIRFGSPSWRQHPPVNHYFPRLQVLSDVFGAQALILKRFSRSDLKHGDIVIDFVSNLNASQDLMTQLVDELEITNSSLSEEAIHIGDAMVNLLSSVDGPTLVEFRDIFCHLLESIDGRSYQLNKLQIDVIMRATAIDSELVLSQFGIDLRDAPPKPINIPALSNDTAYSLARLLIRQVLPDLKLPRPVYFKSHQEQVVLRASGSVSVVTDVIALDGSNYMAGVLVSNESKSWWGGDVAPVCISYHWLNPSGEVVEFEGLRTPLPRSGIEPGGSHIIDMEFFLPKEDGNYQLEVTLVQEFYNWFENLGLNTCRVPVKVESGFLI